jgi:peptide deformylase
MAANMIGILKNIIAVSDNGKIIIMYNPVIIRRDKPFETREGCLSLSGTRPTIRYKEITVSYQNERFANVTKKFVGFTAQIIQHETDHCNGIII